ncbi:uncharacterized protein PG986_005111 [Apiospora aurea]|uniref:Uncharacterized protein n=1 Tax=Apiospora aurea TaxID=335848 RepID=A0ABR1QH06_9PEZI
MWPQDLPPRTTPLILSIVHGHPTMATALLEAGADKIMQGGLQVFLPSGRLLCPIHWLLEQMRKTTSASTQKQWKAVLEIILPVSPVYPDSGQRRRLSPLCQSIHPHIPVEITRMLIKQGSLGKEHMFAPFQYELNNKKTMSAYGLAKQERDQEDPNSYGGYGRARLAMLRRIVYKKNAPRSISTKPPCSSGSDLSYSPAWPPSGSAAPVDNNSTSPETELASRAAGAYCAYKFHPTFPYVGVYVPNNPMGSAQGTGDYWQAQLDDAGTGLVATFNTYVGCHGDDVARALHAASGVWTICANDLGANADEVMAAGGRGGGAVGVVSAQEGGVVAAGYFRYNG